MQTPDKPDARERTFFAQLVYLAVTATTALVIWNTFVSLYNSLGEATGSWSPTSAAFFGFEFPLPEHVAEGIIVCFIAVIIIWVGLSWLCDWEWVEEAHSYEDCWKEKDWWNPFHWVWVLVCVTVTTIVNVLKWVCRWVDVFAILLLILCVVLVIVAFV